MFMQYRRLVLRPTFALPAGPGPSGRGAPEAGAHAPAPTNGRRRRSNDAPGPVDAAALDFA
ncbi:hypothetical protein I2I05_20205 [Hymenobacter sp. BT683]|uniref:Uncharacterized protein n=1 Tax=Hymenobacter jeongseonensis TaxID=2791027 RepID=A0ABS0ING3_9BACT|nr:hypothetical protein [Hymenobacter jeongseonensis]MBF9239727.1 hypothetical protein [Hymenobacter jeongseonensis]